MNPIRIAVLIPALDEAESLPKVLAALPSVARVVVIDNGSTDATSAVARAAGAEVLYASRRGYGTAILAGLTHLRPAPPDVVVIVDADHADPVEQLHLLVGPIARNEADLVQSDRTRTAERGALTTVQRMGNSLATSLIWLTTGHEYADMGPFRAIRWTSLEALGMRDPSWGWNVEMQMKAVQYGLRVREVPLPYRRRRLGRSKISGSVTGATRAGVRIILSVLRYRKVH